MSLECPDLPLLPRTSSPYKEFNLQNITRNLFSLACFFPLNRDESPLHACLQELMEEYEELREEHYAGQEERHYLTFEKAQSKGKKINFVKRSPVCAPLKRGITVVNDYALDDVLDYIDWNPFFQVWVS